MLPKGSGNGTFPEYNPQRGLCPLEQNREFQGKAAGTNLFKPKNVNNWQTSLPVKNFRTSRGGSGALYSQSAIVRVMLAFDVWLDGLPFESSDEVWSYAT